MRKLSWYLLLLAPFLTAQASDNPYTSVRTDEHAVDTPTAEKSTQSPKPTHKRCCKHLSKAEINCIEKGAACVGGMCFGFLSGWAAGMNDCAGKTN